jgi:L-lysine exporter family protein LysE/ArgO
MSSMFLAAFQLGLVYALLPGPILVGSSQRVVSGGWRQGFMFVVGATVADFIYIALLHWGLCNLLVDNFFISLVLGILGGGWLIKLGVDAIRVPIEVYSDNKADKPEGSKTALTDGFIANLLNPLAIVGWVAIGANIVATWNPQGTLQEVDSLFILIIFLSGKKVWQFLVVAVISSVRHQLHWRWLKSLSHVGGICLILFGIGTWVSAADLFV